MISFGNFCHKNCGVTRPQFEEAAYCCSLFCTDVLLGSSIHSCSKFDGSHHHVANVDGLPSSREGEIQLHQQDSDLPLLNVPLRFEIFANNKSISTAFKGTNCSTRGRTPATGRGAGKVWISMCLGCDSAMCFLKSKSTIKESTVSIIIFQGELLNFGRV